MQQMLEKLFTWKYFEPTLFVTIGVLLVLLFIVFFVGNKDKKQKDSEASEPISNDTPAFQDIAPAEDVSVPANEVKTVEEPDITPVVEENPIDNDIPPVVITDAPEISPIDSVEISGNVKEEEPVEVPSVVTSEEDDEPAFEVFSSDADSSALKEDAFGATPSEDIEIPQVTVDSPKEDSNEEIEVPDFKESFNNLASSINKELDELSRLQNDRKSDMADAVKKVEIPNSIEPTPIDNKSTSAEVFSSVYIDREDKPVLTEDKEPDLPLFTNEEEDSSKPDFELPAMKTEEEPKEDAGEVNVPDFSAFDNETFNIK